MALTESKDLQIGMTAPSFQLPDTEGQLVSIDDLSYSKGFLVAFICNHCPYVIHLADHFAQLAKEYQEKGIAFVAISSNDVENYPDDSPEKMKSEKALRGYEFPYLYDESQEVAKAYQAACTPDLYLFDQDKKLFYHGQYDSSRPGKGEATGEDLRKAMDSMIEGKSIDFKVRPCMGCNIKWK